MKNNKGVTLIALVLTIIIIMILASISVYSGANIIRYTNFNKARAEIRVIQENVNEWYKEYKNAKSENDKRTVIENYGLYVDYFAEEEQDDILKKYKKQSFMSTFSKAGVNEDLLNYRFFPSEYLKDKLGINVVFDYLISIPDRNTVLFNGVIYNKKTYYNLYDFGIQNIKETEPNGLSFNLEQGYKKEIVISNIQIQYSRTVEGVNTEANSDVSKFSVFYKKSDDQGLWTNVTKNITKFVDENDGKKVKYKFSVKEYEQYDVKIVTMDKQFEYIDKITLQPRHGISVGDYIKYTSPTASVTFTDADTGYSTYATTPATLTAKDTFRVMDIDNNGNMTLIGAMLSADPQIYFSGAKGYNNAVYTLNKKCSDLYEDTTKGITARSIKVEDITSKFNDTGNGKITTYISNNLPTSTGTYITNIDTVNKTVTYQTITNYPDIFQYEAGGLIDGTATKGVIGQSDSYSGYNGLTTLANKTPKPTNLTVPYTYYNTSHAVGDFKDSAKAAAYQNMFFGTGTYYWLASRCISCVSNRANFDLRFVGDSYFNAGSLYDSIANTTHGYWARVCPVVYLPSSVNITVSKDTSTYHQEHPHEVQ